LFVFVSVIAEETLFLDLNVLSRREWHRFPFLCDCQERKDIGAQNLNHFALHRATQIFHTCLYTERPRFSKVNII